MYIPEDKVSEIINTADIVDVISESVILKKSGSNFFGLCPFHSEKTPSFSVNSQKQIFHCFGCSAGGNVFSYLMKYHAISFPEAVKMLARKYDITVETGPVSNKKRKEIELKEKLFRLNKKVMEYYFSLLNKGSNKAKKYLIDRGITAELINEFQLGFAQDSWDAGVGFLKELKITKKEAVASGLILPRKQKSGFYDRFRNRIIFPIFDINMQVAGFGGRVMDSSMPKYLNSPETPVYNKSRILYGLHASKQYCRQSDNVYIVEGYFDFLSLYQNGIRNCVASLGTALTSDHVRILKGYASKMILVFDSDDAGINAAKRSISTFMKEGVEVKVLVLPEGKDPDAFVQKFGKDAFEDQAGEALSVVEFLTQVAVQKYGLSVEGRVKVLEEMKLHLLQIEDSALRSLYIKDLAEKLNIDEKAVLEKVRDAGSMEKVGELVLSRTENEHEDLESDPREEQILSMMIQFPQIRDEIRNREVLNYFYSTRLKKLGQVILDTQDSKDPFVIKVISKLENNGDREFITSLAMDDIFEEKDIFEKAVILMSRIIKIRKKNENTLTNKIISAEKGCDSDLFELLKKKQQENLKLHSIKQH